MAPTDLHHEIVDYDKKRAVTDPEYARSIIKKPCFLSYNPKFKDLIGPSPKLELIEKRSYQFAHEAGVYIKSTNSEYFTANYQTSAPIELNAINCADNTITRLDYPSVVNGNGACNYNDKILYCSQGSKTIPSALVLIDPKTSESTTLINNFHGRPFNSVNDVVIHHPTGDIFFTDPTYGHEQAFRPSPDLPSQIYRFRPSTSDIWMLADGFAQCNGLCFSPDYSRMYVTDTGAIQAHNGVGDGHQVCVNPRLPASIYVYDVVDGGMLANRRTFAYCDNGVPDGIKCDEKGNVYSGCGDGVHVWDETGLLLGKILVGGTVANFNFVAGGGVWMFGEESLYFCRLKIKGCLVSIECE